MKRPALLCLMLVSLASCREQVQAGLDARDANEVVTALAERGIEAAKVAEKGKRPSWTVEVPARQVSQAVRLLTELKLPRPPRALTRDMVAQTGLVDSPSAERLRHLEGVEGDLEQALESLDGVVSASVELSSPAPLRSGAPTPPARAAVLLRVAAASEEKLREQREPLRALVAGGVEGLRAEDVSLFLDVAAVRQGVPVEPSRDRGLLWGLLLGMLSFAGGFLWLLWARLQTTRPQPPGAPPEAAPQRPTPAEGPPRAPEPSPGSLVALRPSRRAA